MLGGKMSNEDEDEVEDELEAMEKETTMANGIPSMPDAPIRVQQPLPEAPSDDPERAKKRAQEPMAA
jgi:charged multivesicular body protein 6